MHGYLLRNLIISCLISISALILSSFDSVAQIKLAWDPNTPAVAGYKIYYGTASRAYGIPINVGNVTTYTLKGLRAGVTYYIAVTAYNTPDSESSYSNEVSGVITEAVSMPNMLTGPTSGTTGKSYSYTTGGSASSLGNPVQYEFDWRGDGSTELSAWGSAAQSNSWAAAGAYHVRARARSTINTNVVSNWSSSLSVAIGSGPLSLPGTGAATLVSPSGTISDTTPIYKWNAVPGSTWYYLWVNDVTGTKIKQWYSASDAGCASGTGTCSVTPTIGVSGSSKWWIQTYNSVGYGPWSAPMSFIVSPTASSSSSSPGAATLVSPSGTISDTTPIYKWNAVPGSTWYYLWVNDVTGTKIKQWYSASDAGCASGTGTCSVTPTVGVLGSSKWWVETYNSIGYGPWSATLSFRVP